MEPNGNRNIVVVCNKAVFSEKFSPLGFEYRIRSFRPGLWFHIARVFELLKTRRVSTSYLCKNLYQ